jgi:hypothetical protein
MFEIPNSKHQIPNKFEIPNLKVPNVGFCRTPARGPQALRSLRFEAWDLFGIWSLGFGCGSAALGWSRHAWAYGNHDGQSPAAEPWGPWEASVAFVNNWQNCRRCTMLPRRAFDAQTLLRSVREVLDEGVSGRWPQPKQSSSEASDQGFPHG